MHALRLLSFAAVIAIAATSACRTPPSAPAVASEAATATLLTDDYSGLTPGMLSAGVIGAQAEYHYIPTVAPKGNWVVSTFRSDPSQRAWRVIRENGRPLIFQTYTAAPQELPYQHPMLIAGDVLWTDYKVETRFAPDDGKGLAGVMFRYRNDRHYYVAGVSGQTALIKKVAGGKGFRTMNEAVLAEKPFTWTAGAEIPISIDVKGDQIRVTIGNNTVLEARDAAFAGGKIGFTSDMPTKFGAVRVTCSPQVRQTYEQARAKLNAEEDELVAANPKLTLWKKIKTQGFGVARNVRFGDLNGDGKIDVLICQMKRHGPGDGHSEVGCMTAMTFDGEQLWRIGTPDSWAITLTNDVAFQIHDIDGDGKNEVIYCKDQELIVAEGATGKTKYKIPTPETPHDPLRQNQPQRFPRILGDSMVFADFKGIGRASDIVIKNRYRNVWAYNEKLEPLWTLALNTGHYPFPYDIDGDKKDELAVGYSVVSPEGKILWNHEDKVTDHADGLAWVSLTDGAKPTLICNASDEGLLFIDSRGAILKHYQIGHVQNVSVADYRPDLPGLEGVTINFWANQGTVHFFNSNLEIYHDFEPVQHGSMLSPVNWTGKPGEYWLLSANSEEGGLYDGHGRRVVRFPADSHPDLAAAVLDVTGDCRDEIVVWDAYEMWVYTQSDAPKAGKLYKPKRNPLSNTSNYQTTVSLPGWSE